VHLVRQVEAADKANGLHAGGQMIQMSPLEVLGQVARSVELVDEALYRRVVRLSAERLTNAQEASPRPPLRVFDEHGHGSQEGGGLFR
jgi:hypothetical protein